MNPYGNQYQIQICIPAYLAMKTSMYSVRLKNLRMNYCFEDIYTKFKKTEWLEISLLPCV